MAGSGSDTIYVLPQAPGSPAVRVAVLVGDLAGPRLAETEAWLTELVGRDRCPVVLDLTRATLVSAAGVRMLLRSLRALARAGRDTRVVAVDGVVRQALHAARADDVLVLDRTVEAAADVLLARDVSRLGPDARTEQLEEDVAALRAKLAVRPLIAQAIGLLQERYRLPDADAAQALLRTASQDFNVRMVDVAATVLQAPRPLSENGDRWSAASLRTREPDLGFAVRRECGSTTPADVLAAAARRCLAAAEADAADAWLVEPQGTLRLAAQHGLPQDYVDHFDRAARPEAACALTLRTRGRVVVADVGADPVFTGTLARETVLAAGFHALHCTPVTDPDDGRVVAVLSTLHRTSGHTPTALECATLDRIADATGRWLRWHHDDTLLAAAELCHTLAIGEEPPHGASRRSRGSAPR